MASRRAARAQPKTMNARILDLHAEGRMRAGCWLRSWHNILVSLKEVAELQPRQITDPEPL